MLGLTYPVQLTVGQKRVRGGGTLHHMAPELVSNYINKGAGRPTISYDGFACDMWAVGVMLVQLMTGKLPFWPRHGFDYLSMQSVLAEWVGIVNLPSLYRCPCRFGFQGCLCVCLSSMGLLNCMALAELIRGYQSEFCTHSGIACHSHASSWSTSWT